MKITREKPEEENPREAEMRAWAEIDPSSKAGTVHIWSPDDTLTNDGNSPMSVPKTEYDDVGDGMQEGLKVKRP